MKQSLTKLLAGALCSLAVTTGAQADEGMWMLNALGKSSQQQMKELGLKLSAKELYNPNGPSFKDAIVLFGGFCSGVVVSPDGLVFTNHHCGYSAIQEHSAPEHDYLKNGFVAATRADELPNPDLFVSFLVRTEDVTARIKACLTESMSEQRRAHVADSVARAIEKEAVEDTKLYRAEVASYYQGSEYYLSVYKDYKDVRLVYAPPSSLGKFGGDTDNWMWPRHTCDFSVFRIYADADNNPAEYSPQNQPYHAPEGAYAPVSLKGYEEGDYCMTMGYPGSTNRYLSSYGVDERMATGNAARITIRGIKQGIWTKYMNASDAVRIKYATKYAQSSNYWKNSIGMNKSINDLDVIGQKRDLERRLAAWIARHPDMQAKYGTMLADLEKAYARRRDVARARAFFGESMLGSAELPRLATQLMNITPENYQKRREGIDKMLADKFADLEVAIDQEVFARMLAEYRSIVPQTQYHPGFYATIDTAFGGDCAKFAAHLYAHSRLATLEGTRAFLGQPAGGAEKDPMIQVASDLFELSARMAQESGQDDETIARNERKLGDALREMEIDRAFYPDANMTMRMSYGVISSYNPLDAVQYNYFTTTRGILEKAKKGDENKDYFVQPEVLKLFNGQYGRYGNGRGDMNTCFLSTNDITGGNSGSGMFNGRGELIGLAFDGNWEAMSGDLVFSPKLQRCIGVDIRYVLFVMEHYGKATRLIEELKLK